MACKYYIKGTGWVSETQLKDVLNNGLLDSLVAENMITLEDFPLDYDKVKAPDYIREFTRKIPVKKLKTILEKEVRGRQGYPLNMVSALELNEEGTDFKIPLWASPYADKFESLLTSIVTKKIIKQKFAGHSYVLGSQEGFIAEGKASKKEIARLGNRIVFTKNFDPEKGLQPMRYDKETKKMLPAQIMIPFKFRDEDGNMLQAKDFVGEDGLLDLNRIPEKVLQLSGYRIPTLKQNYMRWVEVVGFLPEEEGDLVLAPRDFTKSMGSDFDVDKLYTYMYNTYYKDGKIHTDFLRDRNKIQKEIDRVKLEIKETKESVKLSKEENGILENALRAEEPLRIFRGELISNIKETTKKELDELYRQLSVLKRSYRASRQNDLLDIKKQVLLSTNKDIVAALVKTDGTGDFAELGDRVEEIRKEQGLIREHGTYLSDAYQRMKYRNATAGKNAVGSFSLDSTFNAVTQGKDLVFVNLSSENRKDLFSKKKTPTYKDILELNEEMFKFGDVVSYGDLSNKYTLRSQQLIEKVRQEGRELTDDEKDSLKTKSDIIAALQSAAVDNEKEQVLNKLNINDETFAATRAMLLLGFEEEDIAGMLTSEIIWEYVNKVQSMRSTLKGFVAGVEEKAKNELIDKYDPEQKIMEVVPNHDVSGKELLKGLSNHKLTASDKTTTTNLNQIALLLKFIKLTEVGNDIKKIQSAINSESNGVPKSLIETSQKVKQINDLSSNNLFNAKNLLGEYADLGNGEVLVKPTTINGYAAYYGTMFANDIFAEYFPYQKEGFKKINQEVMLHTGQNVEQLSLTKRAEFEKNIFKNMRSFLFANPDAGLFTEKASKEFERIFIDDRKGGHDSLATILSKLSQESWYRKNGFLNKLTPQINTNGTISRVDFEASAGEDYDVRGIHVGFAELFKKHAVIGTFNGIQYTTRMLAKELAAAAFLEGGNPGPKSYLKYIPSAYLKGTEFGDYLSNIGFNFTNTFGGINADGKGNIDINHPSVFTRQYFQNNPQEARSIELHQINGNLEKTPKEPFTIQKDFISDFQVEVIEEGQTVRRPLKFIVIYDSELPSNYALYEYDNGKYIPLPVLKQSHGITQYSALNTNVRPAEKQNQVKSFPTEGGTSPKFTKGEGGLSLQNKEKAETFNDIPLRNQLNDSHEALDDLVTQVLVHPDIHPRDKELIGLFTDLKEYSNIKLEVVNDTSGERGRGSFNTATNRLMLNKGYLGNESVNYLAYALSHELTHAFTAKPLQLFDRGEYDALTVEEYDIVRKLKNLQNQYIDNLIEREGNQGLANYYQAFFQWKLKENKITQAQYDAKIKQAKERFGDFEELNLPPEHLKEEMWKYYGAVKLAEFVAVALSDENFQRHLNEIVDKDADASFWSQLKDLLIDLINALGIDVKKGSVLASTLKASMDLVYLNGESKDSVQQELTVNEFEQHGSLYRFEVNERDEVIKGSYTQRGKPSKDLNPKTMQAKYEELKLAKAQELLEGTDLKKEEKPTSTSNNPADFTNHSGGALGADTVWGEIGEEFGISGSNHYYVEGHKTPNGNVAITQEQANEADEQLKKANETLKRKFPTNKPFVNSLLRRNWQQVKNADAVFAVGTLTDNFFDGKDVSGGTAWAVQMALDNNKPVYFFEQNEYGDGRWYSLHKGGKAERLREAPTLTPNFAGIGTRKINDNGKQAIRNVYEKTFAQSKVMSEFSYKGKSIDTEFTLTEGQDKALKRLADFAESNEQDFITLQGAAGTGKTSVIGYLQKYLGSSANFIYMSPTHAATAELAFATVKSGNKDLPMTVPSAVYEAFNKETKKTEPAVTKKFAKKLGFGNNIIVVDEASMLPNKDYQLLLQVANKQGFKIIFMGDMNQIPEVMPGATNKQVSKSFSELEQVYLTEVKRTESDSMLTVLTELRTKQTSLIPRIPNTAEIQYLSGKDFRQAIAEDVVKDPENTVLIAYTNKTVQADNAKIRKLLGREGDLQEGDIIVGYLGYASKQIDKKDIANSIRYTIQKVETHPFRNSVKQITATSKKLKKLEEANVIGVSETATGDYYQLSKDDAFTFSDIGNKEMEDNNKLVAAKIKKLYDAKLKALQNPRLWSDFYAIQRGVADDMAQILLGDTYVYNPSTNRMEIYNKANHGALVKKHSILKVEKGVDFGHAITVHKSQGATIENVYFNASSLPKSDATRLFQGEKQVGTERKSLIYVALSRASKKLIIEDSNDSFFYDLGTETPTEQQEGKTGEEIADKDRMNLKFAIENKEFDDEAKESLKRLKDKEDSAEDDDLPGDAEFKNAYEEFLLMCKK